MCGIAGFYNFFPPNVEEVMATTIQSLKYRGPDANNHFSNEGAGVALMHTRLSIVDLSAASNQPFYSNDGRFVMVVNGEIYNYKELRRELNKLYTFRTESDTEVLLALFITDKEHCLDRINGMFALAIYDTQEDEIFLARDRMGKKPLYYSYRDNVLFFASELKAFFQMDVEGDKSIDPEALRWYLHLGYIPEPNSIYQQIKKFPSGHFLQLKKNRELIFHKYWELGMPEATATADYKHTRSILKNLLIDATQLRLNADVPFGAFLSGGTDSSLISAMAMKELSQPLRTFSIGFEDTAFNESVHAKKVAEKLGTAHTEFMVAETEMKMLLPTLTEVFDEPFADSSAIPTMMVAKLASQNVKMVLTGDGGDELFLGYGMYSWARRLSNSFTWPSRYLIAHLLSMGNPRLKRAAEVFKVPCKEARYPHIFSQEQYYFSASEVARLLPNGQLDYGIFHVEGNMSPAQEQAWLDIKFYLKDDLLVKVDRSTMRYGVEARSPLLDHRIVSYAQKIPEAFKWKGNIQKYILKDILYDYLPKELMERPKWGFSIPLAKWLRSDWQMYKDKYLIPLGNYGALDAKTVQFYISEFENGKDYYYNRIWLLVVLSQFLQHHNECIR